MATVVLRLDTRNKKAKRFPITLRVTHKGIPKMVPTGYKIVESDWDASNKKVKKSYPTNSSRVNTRIYNKLSIAEEVISRYAFQLENIDVYSLAEIIKEAINTDVMEKSGSPTVVGKTTFKGYTEQVMEMYRKKGSYSMVKMFQWTLDEIIKYHGSDRLLITEIDEVFILGFEADCLGRGFSVNSIGIILRQVRRIYNLAIKDSKTEVTRNHYPFGQQGYSIKKGKSKKRAINTDYIQAIRELDYQEGSIKWHHRNYLLFMFNMRGMNFVDLAFLKLENIEKDRLVYQRRKTKRGAGVKAFNIRITVEAQSILDYYLKDDRPGGLIFPVMERVIEDPDQQRIHSFYMSKLCNHNGWLKKIGEDAKLPVSLSTYVIRHTFATAGLRKGVSKAVIGDMLGHTSYYTTEAYFDGFEQDVLDDAAEAILE